VSSEKTGVGILGLGKSLPEKVLTNSDLEKMVDTSDEWIVKRTGIQKRRLLEKNQPLYELGVDAANKAMADAGITAEEIDLVIVTTETPDYLAPSMACIIQGKIGAKNAAAFDLNAACSGFMYALTVAKQFIDTGFYKHILIVACEGLSRVVDWKDRATCVLFGDGAGAAVVGPVEQGYGIQAIEMGADGTMGHNITIPCLYMNDEDAAKREHENKNVIWMDGSEVFKFAVRTMAYASEKVIADSNLTLDDIKLIIPHQANSRIIEGAAKRLGVPESKVYVNVQEYGNISSACIPIALNEAVEKGLVSKGDNIVLVGFGGGLTWASSMIRWGK